MAESNCTLYFVLYTNVLSTACSVTYVLLVSGVPRKFIITYEKRHMHKHNWRFE